MFWNLALLSSQGNSIHIFVSPLSVRCRKEQSFVKHKQPLGKGKILNKAMTAHTNYCWVCLHVNECIRPFISALMPLPPRQTAIRPKKSMLRHRQGIRIPAPRLNAAKVLCDPQINVLHLPCPQKAMNSPGQSQLPLKFCFLSPHHKTLTSFSIPSAR